MLGNLLTLKIPLIVCPTAMALLSFLLGRSFFHQKIGISMPEIHVDILSVIFFNSDFCKLFFFDAYSNNKIRK